MTTLSFPLEGLLLPFPIHGGLEEKTDPHLWLQGCAGEPGAAHWNSVMPSKSQRLVQGGNMTQVSPSQSVLELLLELLALSSSASLTKR